MFILLKHVASSSGAIWIIIRNTCHFCTSYYYYYYYFYYNYYYYYYYYYNLYCYIVLFTLFTCKILWT